MELPAIIGRYMYHCDQMKESVSPSLLTLVQMCDFSGFFLISGFFTNLPLPQNILEKK